MSFMRSPYYVWHNGKNIYLPNEMSIKEFDSLVVMRVAELVTKEKVVLKKAIRNAITNHRGNFGCDALCKLQKKKSAMDIIKAFAKQLKKRESKMKTTKSFNICKYCVMKYGIKGSELAENNLETDEDLANHIEEVHGIPVIRKGETEEQTIKRCAKKGIVSDRNKCQCQECKEQRGEF